MFISEEIIRRIVIEELIDVLNEANPYHDADTGRLASSATGNVYSISKPASQRYGNEAAKGIVTAKGKLKAKYGMTDMCGRRTLDGKDISPEYSCSKFKKKYSETIEEAQVSPELDVKCKAAGYQTFQDLLKAIDAAVKAANGEYVQTKK